MTKPKEAKHNKHLILFNDKSLSMSGTPFDSLKASIDQIGQTIFGGQAGTLFDRVNLVFYNTKIDNF